ncbi:hypothetical protein CYMTET_49014 [Cymbomonas tetramitiformis]|uniref:F-box/LRR-repeat protein 15-like leucin rich repeat domain-containing protein n=1 Tax=Cymbomonas tetramitiformis TaxID=36881 RepID=A0AAE0BT01_9CHLO|nr:hypothetical protein CYMTET_49014 [Cymbomonas tetramitiformis]
MCYSTLAEMEECRECDVGTSQRSTHPNKSHWRKDPVGEVLCDHDLLSLIIRSVERAQWPSLRLIDKLWKETINAEVKSLHPKFQVKGSCAVCRSLELLCNRTSSRIGCNRTSSRIELLRRLANTYKSLTNLDLNRNITAPMEMTHDDVKALAPLTALTSLNLSYCSGVTDEGVGALASLTTLTSLDLSYCSGVTDEGVRGLAPLTALTSLNLSYCRGVTDEGVRALAPLTALTSLELSGCSKVTSEGVGALAKLTALTSLDLSLCGGVTSEGVRALAPLTTLKSLDVNSFSGSTDECVRALVTLTSIKSLKAYSSTVICLQGSSAEWRPPSTHHEDKVPGDELESSTLCMERELWIGCVV